MVSFKHGPCHVIVSAGDLGMLGTISTSSTIAVNGTGLFHADDNLVLNGTTITRATDAGITIAAGKTLTLQNGGVATITGSYTNSTASTLAIADTGTAFNVSSTLYLMVEVRTRVGRRRDLRRHA